MMVWLLFIIALMGFLSAFKKLYNLYSGFTHYRNYRGLIKGRAKSSLFLLDET